MLKPKHLIALACAFLVSGSLLPSLATQESSDSEPPLARILVTNDDGIGTKALAQLVVALAEEAEVVVCAPDSNRSGSSQSVAAWTTPMTVREGAVEGASLAVAVGGNPADAVSYGILELGKEKPFDLVISGINTGANVGDVSHYSGTVGAAMEAAYRGVPAIAVSQGGRSRDYALSADFTARFVDQLREHGTQAGLVYSINVPASAAENIQGVAVRPMGGSYLVTQGWSERETEDGETGAVARLAWVQEAPEGSDTAAFNAGYITVTPLKFDWTDREALADLDGWKLTVE